MVKGTKTKGKGGRPKLRAAERRRNILRFRATDAMLKHLTERASRAGKSLSEEIEDTLQRALSGDLFEDVRSAMGGPHTLVLTMIIAQAMQDAGPQAFMLAGGDPIAQGWIYHPFAYDQAARAVERVLTVMRPPGDPTPPEAAPLIEQIDPARRPTGLEPDALAGMLRTFGETVADMKLRTIADPSAARTEGQEKFRERILAALGAADRSGKGGR